MHISVTSQVTLSTGATASNVVMGFIQSPSIDLTTGESTANFRWYISEDASVKLMDAIMPVTLAGDGTIEGRIGSGAVQFTKQELAGAGFPLTVYQKYADMLSDIYGMTAIVVE